LLACGHANLIGLTRGFSRGGTKRFHTPPSAASRC
jgi:hypothetical protein